MSISYKKSIEDIIFNIKLKTGLKEKDIAKKLKYNSSYFSRKISEGGSATLLKKLEAVFPEHSGKETAKVVNLDAADKYDQASLRALIMDYIKLKSLVTKQSVDEIAKELDQNTRILLRDLK